ncbi:MULTISPECIES: plasmid mobilization relaxosome protein MobC [unclassified Polynucleobacter]|nr:MULTISPECIES: plasmid mobilization relaxosome protein MobC [unclassified Polynucleobacter]
MRFEIRLSPSEYNGLVSQALLAEGNSLAQYARNKLIYGGNAAIEHYRQQRDTSKAVIAEIARIGNNVNQIARALNRDDDVSMAMLEELCKVEVRLAAMDQQFQNTLRAQVQS